MAPSPSWQTGDPSQISDAKLISLALVACTIGYIIYQRFLHPLAKIPGPFWASLSRLWITKHSWDGDMATTLIALHDKYGNLVRTAPNEVSVADLSAIKHIYGAGTKFRKSDWYSVWQGRRVFDLFAERNESVHGRQRRLVSRIYSMESLKDLEPYVEDAIKVFRQRMDEQKSRIVDLGNWVQIFAFDVIGEITFSKRFGFLDVGSDDGSFAAITEALRSASWIGQYPFVYWIHDRLAPYIGNKLGITARNGSLRQFAVREIAARKDRGSDHKDMLSKLFAVQKEKPTEFDDNAVTSMASSNIFAGSDTTAISTRAIIYYLLKTPAAKQRLIDEIDTLRQSDMPTGSVTLDQADKMPYLQAVMYEALRMHPAVGLTLPRVVHADGAEIAGHYFPAGSVVGACPWVVHRNREVFGQDADVFRPERWLDEKGQWGGETNGDMLRFFLAFGSGARMCLGKNISWMEMSKLVPTLFMHYNIELADPSAEWEIKTWWFAMQTGVNVRLSPRPSRA
ncbi:hypothetical protein MBLNU230_g1784t1 [Neophaeotheca triangularis]